MQTSILICEMQIQDQVVLWSPGAVHNHSD